MRYILIWTLACLLLTSCSQQNNEATPVEKFIETLKENNGNRLEVPEFNENDIAELLKFRSDLNETSNFPPNPLSSFVMEEVTIGMYVLWTIESIRLRAINDQDAFSFASLNPRIVRKSTGEVLDQKVILPEVAAAYAAWWNSGLTPEENLHINPLGELDLAWN